MPEIFGGVRQSVPEEAECECQDCFEAQTFLAKTSIFELRILRYDGGSRKEAEE